MKIASVRSDIVVFGGGLAGICASIAAAREGRTVSLVERNYFLGGRAGVAHRFPLNEPSARSWIYSRNSGILDELWHQLFKYNTEGTYIGQSRVLQDWISSEERIRFFRETELESVSLEKGRIIVAFAKDHNLHQSIALHGKYYIDCTGVGKISELSGISGEKGVDKNEELPSKGKDQPALGSQSCGCYIRIEQGDVSYPFICPNWVKIRWEDNDFSAQLNLMKSLESNLLGEHLVEWDGVSNEKQLVPEVIALAAWDYLKNRSPISEVMQNLKLVHISENTLPDLSYRANGEVRLALNDLIESKEWDDSVALGSGSIPNSFSLLSINRDELPLSKPFEIPLRAMISKECKNLLLTGSSSSVSELTSRVLGYPSCSSQMGASLGMVASLSLQKKRLPRTLADKGYINEISRHFYRRNHAAGVEGFEDDDNLSLKAKTSASSTLVDWSDLGTKVEQVILTSRCQFQFPVISDLVEKISVTLQAKNQQAFSVKLFEGSGYNNTNPGVCLYSQTIIFEENSNRLEINCNVKVGQNCWHFLELESVQEFSVPLYSDGIVGIIFHNKRPKEKGITRKFFSEFDPVLTSCPLPSPSPGMQIVPKQEVYQPSNTANDSLRPNHLPGLWISKPTDFKYPEFLEFEWDEIQTISTIEINFDPVYDFIYPDKPSSFKYQNFSSLVKDYRIYASGDDAKSTLIADIKDNQLAFNSHSFEPFNARSIEVEIISTHGLPRAQIYQVRIYA